jgi:hypothetical protein
MGYAAGRPVRAPERILGDYDIVFAKGRAALEALAVGTAVIACDAFGAGPMVTTANVGVLRTLEGKYLQWFSPLSVEALTREMERYNPADVAALTKGIRNVAGSDRAVPAFVELYEDARADWARQMADPAAESRASAAYLRWLSLHVKEHLVERDPLAGLSVRIRNRLSRIPWLAPLLLRLSSKIRARW